MLPDIGNELLGELTSGIKLSQIPNDASPDMFPGTIDPGRIRISGRVEIQRVLERRNGF